jgi:hypothetical protein
MVDSQEIKPGDVVFYVLRAKDKPVEPARKWKGQVVHISRYYATVRVLEQGYEQEEETIFVKQIVQVERENHEHEPGELP